MAEGDGGVYNEFKEKLMEGAYDLVNDTIRVALVSGYTPDIDSHTGYSDISGSELSGTGYTSGGAALASKAVTKETGTDVGKFDAANLTWSSIDAGTPSHAVMYDDTHADKLLIAYWELNTATNGGNYTLEWNADGILTIG